MVVAPHWHQLFSLTVPVLEISGCVELDLRGGSDELPAWGGLRLFRRRSCCSCAGGRSRSVLASCRSLTSTVLLPRGGPLASALTFLGLSLPAEMRKTDPCGSHLGQSSAISVAAQLSDPCRCQARGSAKARLEEQAGALGYWPPQGPLRGSVFPHWGNGVHRPSCSPCWEGIRDILAP